MNKILALAFLVLTTSAANAADLDIVRAQFHAYYAASGADVSAPRMRRALDELESLTRQITGPDWLRSDGSWIDINYSETPAGDWGPWDHTRRLVVMAKAYRTPGQALDRKSVV